MVTVEKIMELDIIKKQLTLLGGKNGLHKVVNYITIMEAPDFYKWVSGGEFVLTSWYAYSKDTTGQEYAFSELAKRISCIAIKVERFLDVIPPELIELADKYETPLFAIRWETKFREIIQAVSAELQNFQTNMLIKVERHYNEVMQAALASDDFSKILRISARHLQRDCFCFNAEGKYLGGANPPNSKAKFLSAQASELYQKHLATFTQGYNKTIRIQTDRFEIFACTARKHLLGFLVIAREEDLSEPAVVMAQQTVSVLALKLLEGYESTQKKLSGLLKEIKKGLATKEKLAAFGLKLAEKNLYIACLKSAEVPLSDLVGETSFLRNTQHLLSIVEEKEIIFVGTADKRKALELPPALSSLLSWLQTNRSAAVLALGPVVEELNELSESYALAATTAKVALKVGVYGLLESKNWLLPSLVIKQLDSVELKQIERNVLQPILEYDASTKSDLLQTLKVFVNSAKNDLAAAKLHIHINTLRYRLAKIRDLTGYDPNNSSHLHLLFVAVLIAELKRG